MIAPAAATVPVASGAIPDPSFIARVNSICARGRSQIGAHGKFPYPSFDPLHPDVRLLPKVGAFFAATRAIGARVLRELHDLGNPQAASDQWRLLLALAAQSREIADRQIAAAKASDVPAFVASVNAVAPNEARLGQVGGTIGFNSASPCNGVF